MDTLRLIVDIVVETLIENVVWPGFRAATKRASDVLWLHMESACHRFMEGLGDKPRFIG